MVRITEKDVQKRILNAISINGGTAKTSEVMKISNLSRMSVLEGCRSLRRRMLIRKLPTPIKKIGGWGECTFILRNEKPGTDARIKKLISEIGQ